MSRILLKKLLGLVKTRRYRVVRKRRRIGGLGGPKTAYLAEKESARSIVHRKLEHFNRHYQLAWGKVAIRNQRSRWGSCSKKGNLNFNYRIVELAEPLQDYIIVHELCHLAMFNHSKKFWDLVAETIPDHAGARKALRAHIKNTLSIS